MMIYTWLTDVATAEADIHDICFSTTFHLLWVVGCWLIIIISISFHTSFRRTSIINLMYSCRRDGLLEIEKFMSCEFRPREGNVASFVSEQTSSSTGKTPLAAKSQIVCKHMRNLSYFSLIYDLSKQFLNGFMVSIASSKSCSIQHDVQMFELWFH